MKLLALLADTRMKDVKTVKHKRKEMPVNRGKNINIPPIKKNDESYVGQEEKGKHILEKTERSADGMIKIAKCFWCEESLLLLKRRSTYCSKMSKYKTKLQRKAKNNNNEYNREVVSEGLE